MNTLKEFLKKNNFCKGRYEFGKDLTLKEFLNTCHRGDWILWLFSKTNPEFKREITLAAGHCANTVRHLMKDERSIKAIDTAIAYGEGKVTEEELKLAAEDVYAVAEAVVSAAYINAAAYAAAIAAYAAADAADAKKQNQKLTANICRKYLPLEIWNQEKI